jgi:DNA-binding transcriptional ArsR family regulator
VARDRFAPVRGGELARRVARGHHVESPPFFQHVVDFILYFYSIGIMEKQIAIGALAALAHETRLDVFRLLVQAGPEGLPAGAVGEVLGIPSATLSFHLKELKSSGLIQCDRQGRSRIYSPDLAAVNELIEFLTANCCRGVDGSGSVAEGCDVGSGGGCQPTPPPALEKSTR